MESAPKSSGMTQTIISKIDALRELTEKRWEAQTVINNEILLQLNQLQIKLSDLEKTKTIKKTTTTKAAPVKTKESTNKIEFKNRLDYLTYLWRHERDETIKNFFTKEMMNSLSEATKTDPTLKNKANEALSDAEIGWLYKKYMKANSSLDTKLKAAFEAYKEESKKETLTPASKETEEMD